MLAVTEQANLVRPAATSGPTEYLWVEGDLSASTGSNLQSYSDSSHDLRCPWGRKRVESRTLLPKSGRSSSWEALMVVFLAVAPALEEHAV